nr:MAG TPA: hypothetical protein [Caudoviricetes sp.]
MALVYHPVTRYHRRRNYVQDRNVRSKKWH